MASNVKPRLLVLSSTYPRWAGDPEPGFVHELSKRLVDEFDVTVLCPHSHGVKRSEVVDGVKIRRYRYAPARLETLVNNGGVLGNLKRAPWKWMLLPTFILSQFYLIWRIIRIEKPDIIHAHWLIPQGYLAALLGTILEGAPPFVVTSHGADLFAFRAWPMASIKRFVARKAGFFSVVSNAMRNEAVRLGVDVDRIGVLPMGVDLQHRFTLDTSVPRSRGEILFVGRLVEKKGLRYLVEAMPKILSVCPFAQITVAGFGPEEPALRRQVSRLGLESKIRFLGAAKQVDLPLLYRRAAVFVAPFVESESGDQEGLGLVVVEALGCGCPVVVGDIPATRDVTAFIDQVGVVPPGNVDALAHAVCDILNNQQNLKLRDKDFGALLRRRFDWEAVANKYAVQLKQMIREGLNS